MRSQDPSFVQTPWPRCARVWEVLHAARRHYDAHPNRTRFRTTRPRLRRI
ncbi:hypothetical protein B0H10DRAFT_1980592 [Mycena sp. CBHHK59/15]|nr:hypothetical protein B0H10DRAFT_1980592 [Mycena sp. CBHHK59/15]